MKKQSTLRIETRELCEATGCTTEIIMSLVEHGVLEPAGDSPGNWHFEEQQVCLVRKALRLQKDFDTDIAGAALALDLLDRLDQLRIENQVLRQRLKRFLSE